MEDADLFRQNEWVHADLASRCTHCNRQTSVQRLARTSVAMLLQAYKQMRPVLQQTARWHGHALRATRLSCAIAMQLTHQQ